MKKVLIVSFLTLGIILTSGCSLIKDKQIDNLSANEKSITSQEQIISYQNEEEASYDWIITEQNTRPEEEMNELYLQIKKLFEEKYNLKNDDFSISILLSTENHIRGSIFENPTKEELEIGLLGNGGNFLATKIEGEREIIFDGNWAISCKEMQKYNFPKNMQENFCFDEELLY